MFKPNVDIRIVNDMTTGDRDSEQVMNKWWIQ